MPREEAEEDPLAAEVASVVVASVVEEAAAVAAASGVVPEGSQEAVVAEGEGVGEVGEALVVGGINAPALSCLFPHFMVAPGMAWLNDGVKDTKRILVFGLLLYPLVGGHVVSLQNEKYVKSTG